MSARLNTALAIDGEREAAERCNAAFPPRQSRRRPSLYLASHRRDDGSVVAFDAKGQITDIAYDRPGVGKTETVCDVNRLKAITCPINAGNAVQGRTNVAGAGRAGATNITYTYGAPALAGDLNGNRAGRITKITSQMGIEERRYGKLGETVYEKKTVNTFTSPLKPEVYETRFFFDTFGRLQRLTYPDGEVLTYRYDSGGNLLSAAGEKAVAASGQNHRYQYLHKLFYDKFEQRVLMEQGNGVKTAYTYDAKTRRLNNLTAQKNSGEQFQNLLYTFDKVGNITNLANQVTVPPPNQFGGPTQQHFAYDSLYRLTSAFGTFQSSPQKTHRYDFAMAYDSIHNITQKTQAHVIVQPSGTSVTQKKTTYDFAYAYNPSGPTAIRPHAPIHIGDRAYTYDANGNQTGWTHDQNGTRRTIVWDEENRIQSIFDNGHEKTYKYDDQGNRLIKRGPQGETVYVNQFFTSRPGANGTKHIYAGTTRIASKLLRQDVPNANPAGKTPFEKDLYFYHPDHLGTSNYITDLNGKLYEHLEYFPFGEAWVEENSNTQRTPYLFTAKELDEETGLYYFGARYYDPRTSVWQSGDPVLAKYLSVRGSAGGLVSPINFALYTYGQHNPLKLTDPDGREVFALEFNKNSQYGTLALVWNGWLPDGFYRINTRSDAGGGVRSGVYPYRVGTHPIAGGPSNRTFTDQGDASRGLNLFSDSARENRNLPALSITADGSPSGRTSYSGINLHPGNRMRFDENGNVRDRGPGVTTGSDGCFTVTWTKDPSAPFDREVQGRDPGSWDYYQDVTSSFEDNATGNFFLLRPGEIGNFFREKSNQVKELIDERTEQEE